MMVIDARCLEQLIVEHYGIGFIQFDYIPFPDDVWLSIYNDNNICLFISFITGSSLICYYDYHKNDGSGRIFTFDFNDPQFLDQFFELCSELFL